MSSDLVFFLHRLGIKVYRISSGAKVVELADIISTDIDEISTKLSPFSGESPRLLISDTISYLFHSQIPQTETSLSRDIVLQKIKSEIPENFESTSWDYKVVGSNPDYVEVLVFAPVVDFQNLITKIADSLHINFEVIEPESIAVTRHPNPIVGITFKDDLGAKDEQSLNIVINSTNSSAQSHTSKNIFIIIGFVLFVILNIFLYTKYQQSKTLYLKKVNNFNSYSQTLCLAVQNN